MKLKTDRLPKAVITKIKKIATHPDVWPDVQARADKALRWARGELPTSQLTQRVREGLANGLDPNAVLNGHHPSCFRRAGIKLTAEESAELQRLVIYPDPSFPPKFQHAQSEHAKLLLDMATRPVNWHSPRERKMIYALNRLSACDATNPYLRGEGLTPEGPVPTATWQPLPEDRDSIARIKAEVKARKIKLTASQRRRLELIDLVMQGIPRATVIERTGFAASSIKHLVWSCSRRGVEAVVRSSYAKKE